MRTTTLQSSKASSRLWKLFAAMLLVWLLIPVGQVSAQTSGTLKAYWKFQQTRRNTWPAELVLRSQRRRRQRNHRLG